MKFKVTEVSTTYIKVEYDDGNWTLIPTKTGWKKEDYLRQIGARAPVATVEVSLNDSFILLVVVTVKSAIAAVPLVEKLLDALVQSICSFATKSAKLS